LINVLRLEMSLVGPRPIVASELHHYGDDIAYYYETRPGMTGLWQVSGRSNTSFTGWITLDLHYIDHWSLMLDTKILLKTFITVVKGTGAA
jgi:undecaprenyl-phosphate galactose phosphotransferase